METIQVVLDRTLLRAADRAARKLKTNRSALFREALRAHLARIETLEHELLTVKAKLKKASTPRRAGAKKG